MKTFLKKILKPYNLNDYSSLFDEWVEYNSIYYVRYFSILILGITSLLIPFDFLLYDNPDIYVKTRVILMTFYIIQLVVVFKFFKQKIIKSFNIFILSLPLSYNISYSYFLFKSNPNEAYYPILLLATFFVVLISNMFIYKFYKEQYALTLLSIVSLFMVSIYKPSISSDLIKLIIFNLISTGICIFYRYEFSQSVINKYEYLSTLLPNKFAKLMSVSDQNVNINDLFPTKEYFAVCLCADWRNYQKITNKSSKIQVEEMLEKFYTIIYHELDKLNLNGQYYADWTADELFIIFYGDEKQKNIIKNEALTFAHSLSTTIFMEINSQINQNITYDIGLSSGRGLIGLQGPPNFKKTSITGEVAGNSKRFETQAKNIRLNSDKNSFPIIVMDQNLNNNAEQLNTYKNNMKNEPIKGTVKDIIKYNLFSWVYYKK